MNPEVLRQFFRSGVFLIIVAFILVLSVPRDSAEFVISVCTLGIGLALAALVIAVNRLTR